MSSPPRRIIPSLEETSPYLDASIEDLGDLWPLLDDQENLVAQPGHSSVGIYGTDGNYLSSPPLQAIVSDNISCMFPHEHGSGSLPTMSHDMIGSQLLERQDTALLAGPSVIGQELLFTETPVRDVLKCSEENAGHLISMSDAEKGKRKAVVSPASGEAEDRLISRRTRTGRRAPNRPQTDGEDGSVAKKQDHNAKERVRRMKLNASYLALGALLPQPRRSKKRWSAPMIIDRVVEYIPELKQEIEDLTLKMEKMLELKAEVADSRISSSSAAAAASSDQLESSCPVTISVHDVRSGEELIIQICTKKRRREDPGEDDGIVSLLSNFEAEGLSILSTSTLDVGEDQVCYHLHIQMNGSSHGPDYTATLKGKVISSLTGPPP